MRVRMYLSVCAPCVCMYCVVRVGGGGTHTHTQRMHAPRIANQVNVPLCWSRAGLSPLTQEARTSAHGRDGA